MKRHTNIKAIGIMIWLMLLGTVAEGQVTANFGIRNSSPGCGLPFGISFADSSTTVNGTIVKWFWNFGNGTGSTSQTGSTTYNQAGIYDVRLIVENSLGERDTMVKVGFVDISTHLQVNHTINYTTCYTCSDGSIDLNISGGLQTYSYIWSTGDTQSSIAGLAPGPYSVTISDIGGCTQTRNYTMDSLCGINFGTLIKPTGCNFPNPDGEIQIWPPNPQTGALWSYQWSNGATTKDITTPLAGTYDLTITDNTGCFERYSFFVDSLPTLELYANVSPLAGDCSFFCAGAIGIHPTSATGPYHYDWTGVMCAFPPCSFDTTLAPAGLREVTVTDSRNCINIATYNITEACSFTSIIITSPMACTDSLDGMASVVTTGGTPPYSYTWRTYPYQSGVTSITNVKPGIYNLEVMDATGCTTYEVFTIGAADTLTLTVSSTDATCAGCNDGTITATASGGTPPYLFTINGSPLQLSNIFSNLSVGNYTVDVQDANGCLEQEIITITNACANFSTTVQVEDATCFGDVNGKAWVTVLGGAGPYSWAWSAGTPVATGDTVNSLAAGTYSVTTSDGLGCHDTVSFTIGQPAQIQLSANITHTSCGSCTDGAIDVSAVDGAAPYDYHWGPPIFVSTPNPSGLAMGWYYLTLTDNNGCHANATYFVDSTVCDFVSSGAKIDVSCFGANDGKAWVTATGTSGPYNYIWSAGTVAGAGDTIINLVAGNYTVTTEDAVGCIQINHVTILEPSAITYNTTVTNVSCHGGNDGYILIETTGGQGPPYSGWCGTHWQGSLSNVDSIGGLATGVYTITVSDNSGCASVGSVTITEPTPIQIATTVVDATCPIGCANGSITATPTGGTAPYSFLWNTSQPQTATSLQPGAYSVTVTDMNGCTATATDTVGPFCNLTVSLGNDTAVCFGTYTIGSTIANGTPPYLYTWGPDTSTTSTLTISTPGFYVITVTDDFGCDAVDGITITDAGPTATVGADTTICVGGTAQLSATGGNTYAWSPAAGLSDPTVANPQATPLVTTTYTVSVDNGTCASTRTVVVDVDTDCIWPGDANSDGIADNDDVLAIGIGYGDTGPVRPNASIVWVGQQSADWMSLLASGVNYKHVDTNGDGIINADDTLAITQNYGFTHLKTEESNRAVNPILYIEMPDTVLAGQTSYAHVYLGSDTTPVQNVYGIKFSITYDNTIVDTNTVHLNLDTCWLGTSGVDLLGFTKDLYFNSRVDIALTRINQTSISGGGPIAKVSFTMKDDVSGKDLLAIPMSLEILGERAIDEVEQELTLTTGGKTITVVQDTATGIANLALPNVAIYPNPATDMLYIDAGQYPIQAIKLVNTLGQSIYSQYPSNTSNQLSISTEGFARGVYLLYITTPQGSVAKRLVLY